MKKRLAGVLAALMVLVLGTTTVFADQSTNAAEEYKKIIEKVAELNGKMESVTVKVGNSTVDVKTGAVDEKQYLGAEGSKRKDTDQIVAMQDITGVSGKGPITVTLEVDIPTLKQGQALYVMHKPDGGEWEYYDVKISDGKVTVTMDSFSPVYVVVGDAPTNSGSSGNNSGSSGGSYPVYYPVYYPSSGSNSNGGSGSGSNSGNNNGSTTQPGDSNTPSNGNGNNSDNNGSYNDGYSSGYGDGYEAGRDDAKEEFENNNSDSGNSNGNDSNANNSNGNNSASGTNSSGGTTNVSTRPASGGGAVTAPKTGASLPALPFVAVFAAAGIAVCGKKARKSEK